MKPSEATSLMAALRGAYPHVNIGEGTVKVYAHMLQDVDHEAAQRAVRRWVAEQRYWPAIADLRRLVAEEACALPAPDEALAEVSENLLRFDPEDSSTWWPSWSSPELEGVVRAMGGLNYLHRSSNPSADRAQLMKLYERARERTVESVNLATLGLPTGVAKALSRGDR